jgi:hypothetical protein
MRALLPQLDAATLPKKPEQIPAGQTFMERRAAGTYVKSVDRCVASPRGARHRCLPRLLTERLYLPVVEPTPDLHPGRVGGRRDSVQESLGPASAMANDASFDARIHEVAGTGSSREKSMAEPASMGDPAFAEKACDLAMCKCNAAAPGCSTPQHGWAACELVALAYGRGETAAFDDRILDLAAKMARRTTSRAKQRLWCGMTTGPASPCARSTATRGGGEIPVRYGSCHSWQPKLTQCRRTP